MFRFLRWRFGNFAEEIRFAAGVMTHPDQDHYKGFGKLIREGNISFDALYHNGIMEDRSTRGLCADVEIDGRRYIDELMTDRTALEAFLADTSRWQSGSSKKLYASLLNQAVTGGRVSDIHMLFTKPTETTYVPGFGSQDVVQLQVLGPILETCSDGKERLRWFKERPHSGSYDKGKTKNGHSVVLRLQYGAVSVLLGGDLNSSSETFLLEQHVNGGQTPRNAQERERMIRDARAIFGCDVGKCCHHGSADFTDEFLGCVNAAATVVSSGDEESHAHPRCDTLGAIGLHGRGWRPLIFSTELARSTRENDDPKLRKELQDLNEAIAGTQDATELARLGSERERVQKRLDHNVATYGAINLRTDGERVVMAYKLEQKRVIRDSVANWDIYKLEPAENGELSYVKPKEAVRRRSAEDDDG